VPVTAVQSLISGTPGGSPVENVLLDEKCVITKSGVKIPYDLLVSTLSIDYLLNYKFGKLRYAGYDIKPMIIEKDYYAMFNDQPVSMTYFPEKEHLHGRITDYKTFQKKEDSPAYKNRTIITVETPSMHSELYPYYDEENLNLFDQYLSEVSKNNSVITFGRNGLYRYLTTDTTTEMAFRLLKYLDSWKELSDNERLNAYKVIRGDWNN